MDDSMKKKIENILRNHGYTLSDFSITENVSSSGVISRVIVGGMGVTTSSGVTVTRKINRKKIYFSEKEFEKDLQAGVFD